MLELPEPLPEPELGQLFNPWLVELEDSTVCGLSIGNLDTRATKEIRCCSQLRLQSPWGLLEAKEPQGFFQNIADPGRTAPRGPDKNPRASTREHPAPGAFFFGLVGTSISSRQPHR